MFAKLKGVRQKNKKSIGNLVFPMLPSSLDKSIFGGDKRDRTADLLNAIAPEVLDSVEVA